ncbi:MAG TPA: glycoside hydrolase family 43 protein [Acidimicrobiia bacterium]|nr:glycoside hydrolase family 43 protein [Acidimicrobiia bacterium]
MTEWLRRATTPGADAPRGKAAARRRDRARVTAVVVVAALLIAGIVVLVEGAQTTPCDNVHFQSAGHLVVPSESPPPIAQPGIVRALHQFERGATAAVFCNDFPDPFVLRVGSRYYAYATNTAGANVPVLSTPGLFSSGTRHDALPQLPGWSTPGWVWAPSVLPRGSTYVLYYTTRDVAAGEQCISSAAATDPAGPFVDSSAGPLICPPGGAIDPSPYADPSGQAYLVWKQDPSTIMGQALSADGRSLAGSPAALLHASQPWEGGIVEGPSLVAAGGRVYLFYSGNQWQGANYAIGYAVCQSPLGPCLDTPGPWLSSGGNVEGPGGPEFFTDTSGQTWMSCAAWISGQVGYPQGARNLFVLRVTFPDGVPTAG